MKSKKEIEELGLTKQRRVVLTVIMDSEDHLTANEVFERSKKLLPKISFATVYNSLRFLKEEGHIGEVNFGNGASKFDRMTERHDHAICSACGKLVDIHLDLPAGLVAKAASYSEFEPETLELTLRGKCPECK
ncbi:MAG: transcriptional repressor [Acidobacteria bacterium]|nr:MAG: transcriptional repressor [Acidobacteriota bacterium]REK02913.1 MAG: transcriptional repressor [Acidobacteriota bacterium]REK13283.1 MAG: transcriptional repressor [Acidobacteriota bacterium]REK41277.1 MAG: transcriptional repressor [Acidobacteriota bacterium]